MTYHIVFQIYTLVHFVYTMHKIGSTYAKTNDYKIQEQTLSLLLQKNARLQFRAFSLIIYNCNNCYIVLAAVFKSLVHKEMQACFQIFGHFKYLLDIKD